MAKQDNLDPQTRDLVRFAAAIAQGYEPELRERVGPLRASQVPAAWVEELLLQSVLMVGYPRALIAFAVWRKFSGAPRARADDRTGLQPGRTSGPAGARRSAPGLRRQLRQAARQRAGAAPGHRFVDDHRGLRTHPRPARSRPPAARALHRGADGGARGAAAAPLAPARGAQRGGLLRPDRRRALHREPTPVVRPVEEGQGAVAHGSRGVAPGN